MQHTRKCDGPCVHLQFQINSRRVQLATTNNRRLPIVAPRLVPGPKLPASPMLPLIKTVDVPDVPLEAMATLGSPLGGNRMLRGFVATHAGPLTNGKKAKQVGGGMKPPVRMSRVSAFRRRQRRGAIAAAAQRPHAYHTPTCSLPCPTRHLSGNSGRSDEGLNIVCFIQHVAIVHVVCEKLSLPASGVCLI